MIVGFHSLHMNDKLLAVLCEVLGSHSSAIAASVFWGDTVIGWIVPGILMDHSAFKMLRSTPWHNIMS